MESDFINSKLVVILSNQTFLICNNVSNQHFQSTKIIKTFIEM